MSVDYLTNAFSEIEKNIGVMYDPAIAGKVIEHWDEVIKSGEDECNNL